MQRTLARSVRAFAHARSTALAPARAPSPARRTLSSATASPEPPTVARLLDEVILEHIVCPISKYELRYDAARGLLICPEIRVAYPIRDGLPLLVPSEGRILRDDEEV